MLHTKNEAYFFLNAEFVGTVVADIAKSRAEIEGARLLVYSAALQVSSAEFL
jgi:hypothetical protein